MIKEGLKRIVYTIIFSGLIFIVGYLGVVFFDFITNLFGFCAVPVFLTLCLGALLGNAFYSCKKGNLNGIIQNKI